MNAHQRCWLHEAVSQNSDNRGTTGREEEQNWASQVFLAGLISAHPETNEEPGGQKQEGGRPGQKSNRQKWITSAQTLPVRPGFVKKSLCDKLMMCSVRSRWLVGLCLCEYIFLQAFLWMSLYFGGVVPLMCVAGDTHGDVEKHWLVFVQQVFLGKSLNPALTASLVCVCVLVLVFVTC